MTLCTNDIIRRKKTRKKTCLNDNPSIHPFSITTYHHCTLGRRAQGLFLFSIIQFKYNRKCVFMAHWRAFFCKLLATELINQGLFWHGCMLICFTITSPHFRWKFGTLNLFKNEKQAKILSLRCENVLSSPMYIHWKNHLGPQNWELKPNPTLLLLHTTLWHSWPTSTRLLVQHLVYCGIFYLNFWLSWSFLFS